MYGIGAGALFSGESIVDWLKNLHGVETEEEATKLGQMLIDSGNIFHTEGSQYVFHYYTHNKLFYCLFLQSPECLQNLPRSFIMSQRRK